MIRVITALLACSEADVLFLARVAGLDASDVLSRLTTLFHQGLVFSEDSGRGRRKRKYARLTAAGRDVGRGLWQTIPDEREPLPDEREPLPDKRESLARQA